MNAAVTAKLLPWASSLSANMEASSGSRNAAAASSASSSSSSTEDALITRHHHLPSATTSAASNSSFGGVGNSGPVVAGGSMYKSPAICRYYLRGICRFGDVCRFSHDGVGGEIDSSSSSSLNSPTGDGGNNSSNNKNSSSNNNNDDENDADEASTSAAAANFNIQQQKGTITNTNSTLLANWANAPAFVPSGKRLGRINFNNHNSSSSNNNSNNNENETLGIDINFNDNINNGDDDDDDGDVGDDEEDDVEDGANVFVGGGGGSNVGSCKSWAQVVGAGNNDDVIDDEQQQQQHHLSYVDLPEPGSLDLLCPYENPCPYGVYCAYTMHLELCKMCDLYCLHPTDLEQRRKHNQECLQQHEKDMELSFAIARSRDKTCGICMDTIMEKAGREKRFGILPNCTHIFCLECIRKWRQAKQFEHKITRSCPECRIASDFVCPSAFWVDTKEEKDKLLNDYRAALGVKDCKYFKKGSGKCPFGNKCFYKHALANGKLVDVGCPRRARKLLRQTDEIIDLLDIYLWEFIDQRDFNFLDLLSNTGDFSDDSDDLNDLNDDN